MTQKTSMGMHKLDVRYGDRNTLPYYNGVLLASLLTDALVVDAIDGGRVMSLTTAKQLVPGILAAAGATGGTIPYYAWSGLDSNNYPDTSRTRGMPGYLDVPTEGFGAPNSPGWPGIGFPGGLTGGFATIQHIAAAELSTTEFDTSAAALALYTPGTALTAISAAATGASANDPAYNKKQLRGLMRPVAAATDIIVGFVSAAAWFVGPEGYKTLAFTPTFVIGAGATVLDDVLGVQQP